MRLQRLKQYAGCVGLFWLASLSSHTVIAANAPGGFIETPQTAQARATLSQSQINNLLPNRGKFTFPAPYNTKGFRLTNPSDCGGGNCVHYVGYSYWRNTNNHVGENTMLVLVGLKRPQGGAGPSLIAYNKQTDAVTPLGPVFNSNDNMSWSSAAGMYFSGTMPHTLYVAHSSRLRRYNVFSREYDTVFDVEILLGSNYTIAQAHSSDDDRVHSATLKGGSNFSDLGCVLYREDLNDLTFFPKQGKFDECQVDKSGEWLVIKENVDGQAGEDNRIIKVANLEERLLLDQDGAGGHSDMGHGYMIAANNYDSKANSRVLWKFNDYPLQGTRLYHNKDWNIQAPAHISHTNALPGVSLQNQFACGSSANDETSAHANEIICFGLTGTEETLVVAPVMTNLNSSGGGNYYNKLPKGNLDVTGKYFIWSSNMSGSRLDVFMVKVPDHLLVETSPPEPEVIDIIFYDGFGQ